MHGNNPVLAFEHHDDDPLVRRDQIMLNINKAPQAIEGVDKWDIQCWSAKYPNLKQYLKYTAVIMGVIGVGVISHALYTKNIQPGNIISSVSGLFTSFKNYVSSKMPSTEQVKTFL